MNHLPVKGANVVRVAGEFVAAFELKNDGCIAMCLDRMEQRTMSDNGQAEGKPWYFYEQLTRSTVKQYGGVRGTEESRARWQGCVERRPAGKE